jgi:UDP-3-O-[3-hydroxymyristoyl] glucosamine N-acyltransferase
VKTNVIIPIDEIVQTVKGEIQGNDKIEIKGIASLSEAGSSDISFLGNSKYLSQIDTTEAAAVVVGQNVKLPENSKVKAFVICNNPNKAFAQVIKMFAPPEIKYQVGIHSSAVVESTAEIGNGVSIGACSVISKDAEIGNNTVILPGVYIGPETKIGSDCVIHANVSIRERCIIGNNVIIHSGTSIGSDGFGYEAGPNGIIKIPQVGIVQIDNDVEIGANCTIDRARFGKTLIKTGVKIDNLVHIAHNVEVGEHSMLIGQSGIAGSARIGKGVIIAAQAGINGHITIGDGAQIAGTSGVHKNIAPGAKALGTPAETPKEFMVRYMLPKTIDKLKKKIKELEEKIQSKS